MSNEKRNIASDEDVQRWTTRRKQNMLTVVDFDGTLVEPHEFQYNSVPDSVSIREKIADVLRKADNAIILTARENLRPVRKYLSKTEFAHVPVVSAPDSKGDFLSALGIDDIVFYDDNEDFRDDVRRKLTLSNKKFVIFDENLDLS